MKESSNFYKELDYVTVKVPKRKIAGPPWYQELSIYQTNIVNDLQNHIKSDFDDNSTKRVRQALKELGIQTKIPHNVAKHAVLNCKLYSINFLQKIKEYLSNKIRHVLKKSELMKYTTEERLLVSGIVHIGLPSLFMKLDYCLNDSMTKKKQPFHLYGRSLHKNQKIQSNSLNVKTQKKTHKLRENVIDKNTKQDIIMRNTGLKMKNIDPIMHPLDILFIQFPLDSLFENKKHDQLVAKKGMMEENKINEELECISTLEAPNMISYQDVLIENVSKTYNDDINNQKVITEYDNNLSTTEPPILQSQKLEKSFLEFESVIPSIIISDATSLSDYNSYDSQYLNLSQLIHLKRTISFEYNEYEEVNEKSEIDETIEDEDFSFLIDKQEENDYDQNFVLKTDFDHSFPGRHPNTFNSQSTEKLNNTNISQILEKSSITNIMNNQSKIEDSMIRMFNYQKNVFPDYRLHSIGVNMPQQHNKLIVKSTEIIDKKEIKNKSLQPMNSIPKVSVELDLGKTSNTILNILNPDDTYQRSESKNSKYETIDQTHTCKKDMRKTHIYDEILESIRKLSKWKKLKAVLEFLAILGDPIASLPNIIKLDTIRHWYELRLNSHLTAKQKAELLYSSKRLWRSPKSNILKKLFIPQNPFSNQQLCAKLTWDKKNIVLKKINDIKNSYAKKFKELMLNNTREMYSTFHTIHYKNQLNKDFKRIYYSYFPAREGDIIWR